MAVATVVQIEGSRRVSPVVPGGSRLPAAVVLAGECYETPSPEPLTLAGSRYTGPTVLAGSRRTSVLQLAGLGKSGKTYLHDQDGELVLDNDGLPIEIME